MLKIIRRTYPLEEEGRLNRLESEKTDMTAMDNIGKGKYFILHDICYLALQAIVKGTEVVPGKNCIKKDLSEMMGGN